MILSAGTVTGHATTVTEEAETPMDTEDGTGL